MGDRCTGHCCRYFSVGPPEKLYADLRWRRAEGDDNAKREAQQLEEMLIYRGFFTNPLNRQDSPGHWWTCKHFVVDDNYNGSCQIYEDRPHMCRSFPNGQACAFVECSWDWARKPQRRTIDVPVRNLAKKKWRKRSPIDVPVERLTKKKYQQLEVMLVRDGDDVQVRHIPNEFRIRAGLPVLEEPEFSEYALIAYGMYGGP